MEGIAVHELFWTSENIRHIRRHGGSVGAVNAVFGNAPRYFRNAPNRTASHVMVGPDLKGKFWTVAIRQGEAGIWMPITCFASKPSIIRLYQEQAQTPRTEEED